MDLEKLHEHIEAYLAGTLSPAEKADFEQTLAGDPGLQDEVARHRKAEQVLRFGLYRERKEQLAQLDREIDRRQPLSIRIFRRLAVAASILLLLAAGAHFFAHHRYAPETMAQRLYAEGPQDIYRSDQTPEASSLAVRLAEADRLFHAGQYDDARAIYLEILKENTMENDRVEWNLLMCYLATDPGMPQFDVLISRIIEIPDHAYQKDAEALRKTMSGTLYRLVN